MNQSIIIENNKAIINGKTIEIPKSKSGISITQNGKSIYINGYCYKNGKLKKSLWAWINNYILF